MAYPGVSTHKQQITHEQHLVVRQIKKRITRRVPTAIGQHFNSSLAAVQSEWSGRHCHRGVGTGKRALKEGMAIRV